jgi:hypothetical protein
VSPDGAGLWSGLLQHGRRASGALQVRIARPGVRPALQAACIVLCLLPAGRQVVQDWDAVSRLAGQLKPPEHKLRPPSVVHRTSAFQPGHFIAGRSSR